MNQKQIDEMLNDSKKVDKIMLMGLGIPRDNLSDLRSDELEDIFKYYTSQRILK